MAVVTSSTTRPVRVVARTTSRRASRAPLSALLGLSVALSGATMLTGQAPTGASSPVTATPAPVSGVAVNRVAYLSYGLGGGSGDGDCSDGGTCGSPRGSAFSLGSPAEQGPSSGPAQGVRTPEPAAQDMGGGDSVGGGPGAKPMVKGLGAKDSADGDPGAKPKVKDSVTKGSVKSGQSDTATVNQANSNNTVNKNNINNINNNSTVNNVNSTPNGLPRHSPGSASQGHGAKLDHNKDDSGFVGGILKGLKGLFSGSSSSKSESGPDKDKMNPMHHKTGSGGSGSGVSSSSTASGSSQGQGSKLSQIVSLLQEILAIVTGGGSASSGGPGGSVSGASSAPPAAVTDQQAPQQQAPQPLPAAPTSGSAGSASSQASGGGHGKNAGQSNSASANAGGQPAKSSKKAQ